MRPRKKFKSSGLYARVPFRRTTVYSFQNPQKQAIAADIMGRRLDGALEAIEERKRELWRNSKDKAKWPWKSEFGEWFYAYDHHLSLLYDEADRVMRLMVRSGHIDFDPRA